MPKLADDARATRRTQILAAALTCFARSGYHNTTMADVATEAGVSKGTPYLYFPSKEALYVTLYEEWDCALGERIETAIQALAEDEPLSPRRVLRAVIAAVGAHVSEHAETCRVLMESHTLAAYLPAITEAVETADDRAHRQLERLVRDGVTAGEWPGDTDPTLEARLLAATLHGLMAHWHLAPGSFDWEAVATSLATGGPDG
jgi:TetR/AcrR family transcriptional repressor of uid operon